jgi:hypothetical protein
MAAFFWSPTMEFAMRDLSVLAYANGFTMWHYKAPGREVTVIPGFFDAANDLLTAGDLLLVSASDGARMMCVVPPAAPGHPLQLAPLG